MDYSNKRLNKPVDISVEEKFGNRLRMRVCGICLRGDSILMVSHRGLRDGPFWAPPGGGMEYGSSAAANLEREFREETGLEVRTGRWMFTTEFIQLPLHAVEFFFEVTVLGGTLRTGFDPEMGLPFDPSTIAQGRQLRARQQAKPDSPGQLIQQVRFMPFAEVDVLPPEARHGAFRLIPAAKDIATLNGYHRI